MKFAFLIPLGLLGLLGIVALIIIYVIRPNYQVKRIPSTHIWKLSLKYRRKRIPTSNIRHLLIFLCQLFILTLIAGILAMPGLVTENAVVEDEVIIVIDSSASMYAGVDGETRFMRAIDGAEALARRVFSRGGYVSVIIADDKPEYIAQRRTSSSAALLYKEFDDMRLEQYSCYFGSSDMEAAMRLCEEVLIDNPTSQIHLFTDTQYEYVPDRITLEWDTVVGKEYAKLEWNVAILDASVERIDNIYSLTVDVAYYGTGTISLDVNVTVEGANSLDQLDAGEKIKFSHGVNLEPGMPKKIIFREIPSESTLDTEYRTLNSGELFSTFKEIHVDIEPELDDQHPDFDCFSIDDHFNIYGGQKDILRIQYASSLPNPFFTGALDVFTNLLSNKYNVQFVDVPKGKAPELEGFDLYIFEHAMPDRLPIDGVVFLIDPDKGPSGSGISVNGVYQFYDDVSLTQGTAHKLTQYIDADNIQIQKYTRMSVDPSYEILLTCDGYPVYVAQKNADFQVAVLGIDLHYSYLAVRPEFVIMLYNLFEYYFPATLEKYAFSVGEEVQLNSRGPSLKVSGSRSSEEFEELPCSKRFDLPDTYTVAMTTYFSYEEYLSNFYVKIPASESDTLQHADTLTAPYREDRETINFDDWLIFLAAAIVFLLFAEWWLQWRESR